MWQKWGCDIWGETEKMFFLEHLAELLPRRLRKRLVLERHSGWEVRELSPLGGCEWILRG